MNLAPVVKRLDKCRTILCPLSASLVRPLWIDHYSVRRRCGRDLEGCNEGVGTTIGTETTESGGWRCRELGPTPVPHTMMVRPEMIPTPVAIFGAACAYSIEATVATREFSGIA